MFSNKIILITGGTGSFGSAFVRYVIKKKINFREIRIFSRDEKKQDDFRKEIKNSKIKFFIGDVKDENSIDQSIRNVDFIFHAAAYKHVPLMEANPAEAIRNNIGGTKIIAELSAQFKAEQFIMISTDKAVNPTNVMGASKRIAEMLVTELNEQYHTAYITTRFGNVLGSNGSVIPVFEKQIANGGPLTLTDAEITRFFMTIPEACQLVLEAATMGHGGEIFVFDMGAPVKILDLAKKMIQLSGLKPYTDIDIQITGLRPGEKRYEEVLANAENTMPTYHPQILIANTRPVAAPQRKMIDNLLATAAKQDNEASVRIMKQLVPEYISNNSLFEKLDQ